MRPQAGCEPTTHLGFARDDRELRDALVEMMKDFPQWPARREGELGSMSGRVRVFRGAVVAAIGLMLACTTGCTLAVQGVPEPGSSGAVVSDDVPGPASNGGGSSSASHELTLEVTGDGAVTSLTYAVNGESTTETAVVLPWSKSISLPSDDGPQEWSLTVEQASGFVEMTASVDGAILTQGSGTGQSSGTLSGEVG